MSVNMCSSCLKPYIDPKVLILFSLSLRISFFLFCGMNKIVLPHSTALATSQQNRSRGSWEVLVSKNVIYSLLKYLMKSGFMSNDI